MDEKEAKDVLELILSGERVTKQVKTKRGTFTIAFPLPRDLRNIEVAVARMMEGLPADSFSKEQIASFRAYATLERVIVDSPGWWQKLDSPEDCPDDKLIAFIYGRYLLLYQSTQKSIGKSGFGGDDGVGKPKGKIETVGD
jgi:hypothetical protein